MFSTRNGNFSWPRMIWPSQGRRQHRQQWALSVHSEVVGRSRPAGYPGNGNRKGKKQMIPLLKLAIEAHGGLERWREVHGIDLKLRIGGCPWQLKGPPQGLLDRALHIETPPRLGTITPFGPGWTAAVSSPRRRFES